MGKLIKKYKRLCIKVHSKHKIIEFNINDEIKVKLTECGKDVLLKYRDRKDFPEYYSNCIDDDGYCSFLFWEFTNIYGRHFYNGQPNQFIVNNTILIKKR